jgi:cytochrome c553
MKRGARTIVILMLAAALSASTHVPDAAAQSPPIKPGEELRPMYATPEDIATGKQLADSACAGCHGTNGISTTTGIPNLAGQRAAYLYMELKAYQSGGRKNAAMNTSVRFISDDALVKVAAYYASLDPAQPAPGVPTYLDPVQAGKTAAAACAGCHGEAGVSKTPGIPSLAGLAPQYLTTAMKAYRSGQRKNDTMKSMLAAVGDADINHLALYYALQKPIRTQTPAPADQQAGKAGAVGCSGCHGDQGVSSNPATPSLAGQDARYLAAALRAYKNGSRADETMKALAASLDDSKLKDIAAYYAAQVPQAPNVRRPLTAQQWAQKCDRCHGLNGNSTDPQIPALAAQRVEYLQRALRDYQTHARVRPVMAAMADVLSEDDVRNLATYYSHQKARAFVFMAVPGK